MKHLIFLMASVLFLSGCQTTTSVNLVPKGNQDATFVEGQTAIKSTLPNSTVVVSSAFNEIENGSRIDVVVNVNNTSGESFILDTSSFQISSPNTGPLIGHSYE
jgi:PBP1b-binding outer membrane lipoprotein LpoB